MEELEDNLSSEDIKDTDSPSIKIRPKKRSLVERELETNLTERITSPITNGDSTNTSRYGRARRLKTESETNDTEKVMRTLKSPPSDKSTIKSPVYKMHASNSPIRVESPSKPAQCNLDHQIESIYNENISLSRFGDDKKYISPPKNSQKVYVRKDLIQSKEKEETVTLIKHIYSPVRGNQKSHTHLSNVLERSERFGLNNNKQNGYFDNSSVVKTLDFDGNKKKKPKEIGGVMSKSDLFELEAKCEYQVGDLAWAKMGTYPFWPCIVTRDPYSGMFVKKKLFGRIDRDVIHVTFFGDNGRRSWIVDNMLRKFLGQLEFETTRDKFTPEARKKDPKCAAFFVSERKLTQWRVSVEEAETLLREPKRLRIDMLNDMLNKTRTVKTTPKGSRKISRTDSDVSLSESLYDTLFSEDDSKTNDLERSKSKTRNKSLDVSEVVTACLDNMAAKTGITKIQKQSHMDRWLQKAKSKTPEKSQFKSQSSKTQDRYKNKSKKVKKEHDLTKPFRFTTSDNESLSETDKLQSHQNEHDYSSQYANDITIEVSNEPGSDTNLGNGSDFITKVESLNDVLNTHDEVVMMSDDYIVSEEVIASDDVIVESDGNNVDLQTVQDDAVSNITISSAESKNLDDNDLSMNASDSQLTFKANDLIDDATTISSTISTNFECNIVVPLNDSENRKNSISDSVEEPSHVILEDNSDVNSAKTLNSSKTNGHDEETNDKDCFDQESAMDYEEVNKVVSDEDGSEISMGWPPNTVHDVTNDEDQEKQDVNIVKQILSDKLVETNGSTNRTSINDDSNNVSDDVESKTSIHTDNEESKMLEDNSSTDSSQYNVTNNMYNKEMFNINKTLVASVNNISADIFYGDNTQETDSLKTDTSDNESVMSSKFKSKNNTGLVINGYMHNKDDLETDSVTRNSDSYSSSEDDDRSSNSTPVNVNNFNDFSNINKCKSTLIQTVRKNLNLRNVSDNDEEIISSKKVVNTIHVHDTLEDDVSAHDDVNTDGTSQHTTEESERCSTESNNTCDSDKSVYSDDQTETTETTDTMDVDESTYDSIIPNGYHEPSKEGVEIESIDINKITSHVDLSKERAIMNGDELRLTPSGLEIIKENSNKKEEVITINNVIKEKDEDTASIISTDSEVSLSKRRMRWKGEKQSVTEKKSNVINRMEEPEFLKYLELKQDAIYDEHPELSQDEITTYLYNTWLYEESLKTDRKKTDDMESANMVKGLQSESVTQPKKVRKRIKVEKEKDYEPVKDAEIVPKQKPKRRTVRPSYNEEYSDVEEDLEVFPIFKPMRKELKVLVSNIEGGSENGEVLETIEVEEGEEEIDEIEEYFAQLAEPKPNVFKGLLREKVCEICERTGNLVKCKGCSCMFHVDCVKKETDVIEVQIPMKGRKKKKKFKGRKSKSDDGLDESSDANVSEEMASTSTDNIEPESHIVADADDFEAQLAIKMKELLAETDNVEYDSLSSDDELDWSDTEAGKCEVIDIKLKTKKDELIDYSDFKCNNCQKYDVPICFVCRNAESPKNNALHRQRCQVPQCNKYYHLECLEHWPQTQFNSGECARYNKKINEYFEALSCPRHVCHTCVSDDPRGCKTRFSGDKLARCVRCPATYHSFTKCLPAGTQILTGSHIICPRHYEHRPGKVPCHVNTGWCFICALGGTLICCEYCPTSFHAECLNIKPPEGGYMCEDCETGRLPLYGEMVWVKLGHYRWWPGIILHPCEIPENLLAVKHSPGEFVVRFFGQYDHYWVNRGRVFPFQEGDSGKVSSQKSKIDAAFTMAMEHAQRACEILKSAAPNEEESSDIASSLLPPHYVKLRANKPCGALVNRRPDEESSLTQCECSPDDECPCGPYSHCLNRMLLTECGPTCRAGERCNNRAFEKRLYPKLVPYRTPHRGWGLKTLEDIKAGQFVIEYVGELIDEEEFQRRMRRKHEIRDENFYFLTLDKERMIDAGPKGNLARFMNHCCEPNCETQKWTVLGDVRVGLFALYDIPANSEVTFNYNLESAGIEKKRCLCGAKRCSGYIGAKPKQADQPKKNKLAAKRTYKKRKIEDSPSTSKIKPKSKLGRPPKPKELSEIEKDLLIIKNATNGISSDSDCSGRLSSIESVKDLKASKRKRGGMSTEEAISNSNSPTTKKIKLTEEKTIEVGD
ncbi:uncharacterized protein [Epargyreus clarus]|uniref:uncharacterized protein isoform X2 n=1 Tax=Epargyreus clarus TaxID=520877 RepID=UPI003C2E9694